MNGVNFYQQFQALHKPQLISSRVPEHFWETLYNKITHEIFDAGSAFSLMLIDYGDLPREETSPVWTVCVSKSGLDAHDPNEIYLIDHAWTFKANQAKEQLELHPQLSTRMAIIMGIDKDDPTKIEKILNALWRYCQSYSVQADGIPVEARMPIWYVMDELGSGVNHSEEPNFRIVPFLYIPTQTTYSLLFPVTSVEEGDIITRDFVESIARDDKERNALLLPWKYTDFRMEDFSQKEPEEAYFISGHIPESLSEDSCEPQISRDEPLKVFSEYDVLTRNLTAVSFEVTDNEDNANILWLNRHFKSFEELSRDSPTKFINQFPYEYVITIKDLLSIICRRRSEQHHDAASLETFPKWLPTTYNLKTELLEFVSYFQHREERDLDNHWIIKPWNLARGLDTHITSNLAQIMRLPPTGPKIAQKYIENPVLFYREEIGHRVKFDVRFVILLKSVQPLEAYVYTNFFLRFANKPFSLENFEDYEKHFTVMNYNDEAELRHMRCEDFIMTWKEQYPDHKWENIQDDMCDMLNEVLLCATMKTPPCGIAPNPQSRALYAADIMLAWDGDRIQPKLLEINWMPDCKRACEYYPDFFNDIFKLLFLNEIDEEIFRLITIKD